MLASTRHADTKQLSDPKRHTGSECANAHHAETTVSHTASGKHRDHRADKEQSDRTGDRGPGPGVQPGAPDGG